MANQPRPWFRLTSIVRPAAAPAPTQPQEPPPPPPSQPRPAFLPPFRPTAPTQTQESATTTAPPPPPAATLPRVVVAGVSSVPTSPVPKVTGPSSLPPSPAPAATISSLPSSPKPTIVSAPTASLPSSPAPVAAPATYSFPPSAAESSRAIKPAVETPLQSPKPKLTAAPPSPISLPPSQIISDAEPEAKIPPEAEQKTVLVQKTIDQKPKHKPNGSGESDRGFMDTKKKDQRKKIFSSDSEDGGMKVITIAGENKGAFMEVIRSPKKNAFNGNPQYLYKHGDPGSNGTERRSHLSSGSSSSSSSSGEEEKPKIKDKSQKGKASGSLPMSAFMNSNVQGVNNSIVFNSSCAHHDPGVHLAFSRKPAGGEYQVKGRGSGHQG